MTEIELKYKIYEKKFGFVNWIGLWTIYKKEVLRFITVIFQTVVSPLVTSLLFLLVLSLSIADFRGEVLGHPFIIFLAPGLIAMQVIQQSFGHSSSSIMIGKIQGNIVDMLYAPLTASEITIGINLAATTRCFLITLVSVIGFSFFVELEFYSLFHIIITHSIWYLVVYRTYQSLLVSFEPPPNAIFGK